MLKGARVIKEIVRLGKSKYWIAKNCHVSWNTVHMWSRGVFEPNRGNLLKLDLALKIAAQNGANK
jgi:hypothetical protein